MRAHLRDLSGLALTPARLLLRHWPVLVGLAVAGFVARRILVNTAVYLAGVNAVLGFAVLSIVPLALLAAVVLMLGTVRPSLSAMEAFDVDRLGSALIPFLVLYLGYGLLDDDLRAYAAGLADGRAANLTRDPGVAWTLVLLGVVVFAAGLRWLLGRFRQPRLAAFASGVETIGIIVGVLHVLRPYAIMVWSWVQERAVWHELAGFADVFQYVTAIFVVPLTGLLVACVVFGVGDGRAPGTRPQGIRRHRVGAMALRRYAPMVQGLRAARRTGVVPVMMLCLAVVVLQTATGWLRLAEARLIGPHEPDSLVVAYQPSIDVANQVLALLVLVGLLAAGAELVARHQASPSDASPSVAAAPSETDARPAMPPAPPPQWPLPQPAWAGTSDGMLAPPAWPGDPPPGH